MKSTTYFDGGSKCETYKWKGDGVVRILVKKDGKPFQAIRFNRLTGQMLQPNWNN